MDAKPDFGGTTAIVAYVRQHVTPKGLWWAIAGLLGTLVPALFIAITWIVTTRSGMEELQGKVKESKQSVTDMQQKLDMFQDMRTDIAVIKSTMVEFKAEQDRNRERWDRIDRIAELPPHARRR